MSNSHQSIIRSAVVAVFATLPAFWMAQTAVAEASGGEARSVTLHYHDLDLNGAGGIAGLYRRIRVAAGEVCSPLEGRDLVRPAVWRDCYDHAVANAVRAVHNDRLSAYHLQRTRGLKHRDIDTPTIVATR